MYLFDGLYYKEISLSDINLCKNELTNLLISDWSKCGMN